MRKATFIFLVVLGLLMQSAINGQISAQVVYHSWVVSGNNLYYDQGNVGINTTTPQKHLDIAGDLRLGLGGDSGRIWSDYLSGGKTLILYDMDEATSIRFRNSPLTNNEISPEFEAVIKARNGEICIGKCY